MVQLTKENLIYIGVSGTIAVAALALIGSSIFSGATTEGLEIGQTSIKKASGDAVVTIQVKNVGTSQIEDVVVGINAIDVGTINLSGVNQDFTSDADGISGGGTSVDTSTATIYFKHDNPPGPPNISAGQTTSYSGTIPNSKDNLTVGESFVITATGKVNNNDITATAVATVTRF